MAGVAFLSLVCWALAQAPESRPASRPASRPGGPAARDGLLRHFGPLSPKSTLEVERVQHSASGRDKPVFDWDRGHTIAFHLFYDGVRTDRAVILYLVGRSRFSGSIGLFAIEPVAGSAKKTISKESVLAALRAQAAAQGVPSSKLGELEKRMNANPRIEYVWSPEHNRGAKYPREYETLAPQWVLFDDARILADAHTGKLWFND